MTPVTIVGMIAGAVLIVVVVVVFLRKQEFSSGGVVVTVIGLILLTLSQWSSIRLSAAGTTLELVKETAAAADQVAAQTQQTAAALETTRQQLSALAAQLGAKNVLTAPTLHAMQSTLAAVPRVDVNRVLEARRTLTRIVLTKP